LSGSPRTIFGFCASSGFTRASGSGVPDVAALEACTARANDLMALSRERIADELLKLLAVDDPVPTVRVMLERKILKPVMPEIQRGAEDALQALVSAEGEAGFEGDPLRRLVALLPRDPELAETIASRLKLSNREKKRARCAAEADVAADPKPVAYRAGLACSVDRLLLAGRVAEAKEIARWDPPRLPIRGGMLIKLGLPEGPLVSRALRLIEDRWIEAGFPSGPDFDAIVAEVLASSR
jgi:poly(A) polymerase